MRILLSAVAGAALLALAVAGTDGRAEEAGLYFGADFGLFDFDLPGKANELQGCGGGRCDNIGSPSYDDINFRLSGVVGLGLTENFRAEGELFFDIDTASGSRHEGSGHSASVSADVRTYGTMVNGWFDIGTSTTWAAYIGGGAGLLFAETSHNIVSRAGEALSSGGDDSDTETAYQLGAGAHFEGWHVGYRFLRSSDLNDYGNITEHILLVGLRIW